VILINGELNDKLSVRDRAIQYGDGLFETFAVKNGEALAWDLHITRLQSSSIRLGIECPDPALLKREVSSISQHARRAVLKLIISRGEGGRGYQLPTSALPTRIISLHEWPDYPVNYMNEGIVATVCKMRMACNPVLAGMKHLNRLEQVLLKKELLGSDFPEAVVLDINDNVIEGCMSNIFLVKNKQLFTPDLSNSGVEGVVREGIVQLAESLKLKCEILPLQINDVMNADEVFFCNSVAGIWPVKKINDKIFTMESITRRVQKLLIDKNLIIAQ
jgi:4-amino-4-deoxychorismate lyase